MPVYTYSSVRAEENKNGVIIIYKYIIKVPYTIWAHEPTSYMK